MNRNVPVILLCLLFISAGAYAQTDAFAGTWHLQYRQDPNTPLVNLELQIAPPERNIIYPSHLKIQSENFAAEYELVLVRKNSRELAISRNKYPLSEMPFSLLDYTYFLNGFFKLSKDAGGIPSLTLLKIQPGQSGNLNPVKSNLDETYRKQALYLRKFFLTADIKLRKVNNSTWQNKQQDPELNTPLRLKYFGVLDTVFLPGRDGIINLASDKKNNTDIVSVALNGRTIVDLKQLNKKNYKEDLLLDTGLNFLVLFAENFGNDMPNKGKLELEFAAKKLLLDFTNKADSGATFIVAKLYCGREKSKNTFFVDNPMPPGDTLKYNEKILGSIIVHSQQLTLAIWDDATEDGDSISINIDGSWIVKGLPVKKRPQFISVKLKPGPNTISFIGDNLGTIPPNTSVLEIIDGKKRKSFAMETNIGETNLIKIYYNIKPEQ